MIARLRGSITKDAPGSAIVDVQGVGYAVAMPLPVWDDLTEGTDGTLWISTYVREDRFELFGFADAATRTLFEHLIDIAGIGPRIALDLCGAPRGMLLEAATTRDGKSLTSIKGIGRKTADKLAVELASLAERDPQLFLTDTASLQAMASGAADTDTVAALSNLGYATADILRALQNMPKEPASTEERIALALKHL